MDTDEERDFADQGSPSDFELEDDNQILATLLKQILACIDAADIELLLQDIPVQPPVMIPARSMQEAIHGRGCCQRLLQEQMHSSGARPST